MQMMMYCVTEDEICFQREIWLERLGHGKRKITQWQYKEWSDFAVPDDASALLSFMEAIRVTMPKRGPTLVHCSAGVGRTGVYIALDILLDKLAESKMIDVMGTVRNLRASRTTMVQNVEQYMTVYEVIALAIRKEASRR